MSRLIYSSLFILSSFFAASANAEYRAFQLLITDETAQSERTVITTFDDIQFPMYHVVRKTEKIRILDTWMCWGRTDQFKPICPSPNPEAASPADPRAPAAQPSP